MIPAHQHLNLKRLFLIGSLSIFLVGLGFAVRASIAADLQRDIFDVLDVANSAAMVGEALGITLLVDYIGMRAMLLLSATGYVLGSVLVLAAA